MQGNATVRAVPRLNHLHRVVLAGGTALVLLSLVPAWGAVLVLGESVGTPQIAAAAAVAATAVLVSLHRLSPMALGVVVFLATALAVAAGNEATYRGVLPAYVIVGLLFGLSGKGQAARLGVGVSALAALTSPVWANASSVELAVAVTLVTALAGLLALGATEEPTDDEHDATLFDAAPVALSEQDWSAVEDWLEEQRKAGVTDLEALLDREPDLVHQAVSLVRVTRVNRAALALYGIDDPADVIGPFRADRVNDRSIEHYKRQLVSMFRGDLLALTEILTYDFAGRPIHHRLDFARLPDKGHLLVAAMDISDLHEIQKQLEAVIESRDRFVASVSHELRSPVSSVLGFAYELSRRYHEFSDQERVELLGLIAREAQDVADIIEDLLVASRAEVGTVPLTIETLDLYAEIGNIISVTDIDITVDAPTPPVMAIGDSMRVRQIVRNLVTNAARYGGPDRRISYGYDNEVAYVEVSDNGPDISDETLEELFAPYSHRADHPGVSGSIGLGLTVARSLAEAMGGSLTARREGAITVFRLELPAG